MSGSFHRPLMGFVLLGCAPNIGDRLSDSGDTGSEFVNVENEGGTTTTVVDSSDYEVWAYLDFESGELVTVGEPQSDLGWDVGFQRYNVKLNGGVSGSGNMEVAISDSVVFDDVDVAPDGNFVSDLGDSDEDGVPEYAMAAWYAYDPSTHILTPAEQVYVLRTVEEGYVKFRFDDYYDEAGTSGFLKFTWGFVDEPTGDGEIWDSGGGDGTDDDGVGDDDIDKSGEDDSSVSCSANEGLVSTTVSDDGYLSELNTSATDAWTCLSLTSGEQVSKNWSIAWQQWTIALPIGSSGVVLESKDFDALTRAPAEGWSWNNMSLFEDWYDYNPVSHELTPRDFVYVVRDPDGGHWKLQITTYYDESDNLHRPTMRWAAIDAPQ